MTIFYTALFKVHFSHKLVFFYYWSYVYYHLILHNKKQQLLFYSLLASWIIWVWHTCRITFFLDKLLLLCQWSLWSVVSWDWSLLYHSVQGQPLLRYYTSRNLIPLHHWFTGELSLESVKRLQWIFLLHWWSLCLWVHFYQPKMLHPHSWDISGINLVPHC